MVGTVVAKECLIKVHITLLSQDSEPPFLATLLKLDLADLARSWLHPDMTWAIWAIVK